MSDSHADEVPWRCLFCHMPTGVRLFRIPVCEICRDQLQDFAWVSVIMVALLPTGWVSGGQFVVEEVAFFAVLVLVKHRLPRLFDRFIERA